MDIKQTIGKIAGYFLIVVIGSFASFLIGLLAYHMWLDIGAWTIVLLVLIATVIISALAWIFWS